MLKYMLKLNHKAKEIIIKYQNYCSKRKRKTLEILKGRAEEVFQEKMRKQERDQFDEAASNLWRRRFLQ